MALINVSCFSTVLHMSINIRVIMPQNIDIVNPVNGGNFEKPYPVLYLLHGYNGDHTVWSRRTSVERYAADKGIIIVMPAAHNSWYSDDCIGFKYWTFVSEELPGIIHDLFPQTTQDPAKTFAAGLSMGGYGAFKLGLALPEKFRAVASLSGAVDVAALAKRMESSNPGTLKSMYGGKEIKGSDEDLFALADKAVKEGKKLPKMYQWCGRQDFLYQDNLNLRDYLKGLGADLTYEEGDGDHQWQYWDAGIERVLNWIDDILKNK